MADIIGTENFDGLIGTEFADKFTPKDGSDYIDGKGGPDTVYLDGKLLDYTFRQNSDGSIRILYIPSGNTKIAKNIEYFSISGSIYSWDSGIRGLVPYYSTPTPTPSTPSTITVEVLPATLVINGVTYKKV